MFVEKQKLFELEDMRNTRPSKTLVTKYNLILVVTTMVNIHRFACEVYNIKKVKKNKMKAILLYYCTFI